MRKRESNNGKPEKKEEKDKLKDFHESIDKKEKELKKDSDDKSPESGGFFMLLSNIRENFSNCYENVSC